MPLKLVCYNGHAFEVEEHFAGKEVVCPTCQSAVRVPQFDSESKAPAGQVFCPSCGKKALPHETRCAHCDARIREATPRFQREQQLPQTPERRKKQRLSLAQEVASFPSVHLGLTFHSARILTSLLATVLIVGMASYASARSAAARMELIAWIEVGLRCGVALWLVSITFGFFGSILCLRLPADRLPLARALCLDVATVPLGIAAIFAWTPLLCWAAGVCSWTLFTAFVVRLAAYIDRPSERDEARTLVFYGLIIVTMSTALGALTILAPRASAIGIAVAVLLPISGFLYGGLQIITLRLLESLRQTLRQQLDEARTGTTRQGKVRNAVEAAPADCGDASASGLQRACPVCDAALPENAVLCVECGYDFRLGEARVTVLEKERKTPQHRVAGGAKSRKQSSRFSVRNIFAWLLIVLGLMGLTGGPFMFYFASVMENTEKEAARGGQGPFNPLPAMPKSKLSGEIANMYIYATAWSVLGLVFTYTGIRLRRASTSRGDTMSRAVGKRRCFSCQRLTPADSQRCYHCGKQF